MFVIVPIRILEGFVADGGDPENDFPGDSDNFDGENKTYKVMSYATGPGDDYPSLVKMAEGAHSGEDVPIYATGPWAHLFVGSMDNTLIPNIVAYAACIGPFKGDNCHETQVKRAVIHMKNAPVGS